MRGGVRAAVAVGGISLLGMALSAASARSSSMSLVPADAGLRASCAARGRSVPALVADPAPAPVAGRAPATC